MSSTSIVFELWNRFSHTSRHKQVAIFNSQHLHKSWFNFNTLPIYYLQFWEKKNEKMICNQQGFRCFDRNHQHWTSHIVPWRTLALNPGVFAVSVIILFHIYIQHLHASISVPLINRSSTQKISAHHPSHYLLPCGDLLLWSCSEIPTRIS